MSVKGVVASMGPESMQHLAVNSKGVDVAPHPTHLPHGLHSLWGHPGSAFVSFIPKPLTDYLLGPPFLWE